MKIVRQCWQFCKQKIDDKNFRDRVAIFEFDILRVSKDGQQDLVTMKDFELAMKRNEIISKQVAVEDLLHEFNEYRKNRKMTLDSLECWLVNKLSNTIADQERQDRDWVKEKNGVLR